MPCFVLISMSLHAHIFRFTCLGFYAMFPLFCSFLFFALMIGLCAHVLDTMSMGMLFPCFVLRSASVHAYMLGFTFFHVYMLSFHMLTHFLRMPMPRSMFMYLDLRFHMLVCLDLWFACFIPSSMCLCAPCHVCVPRPRLCFSCHVLL